MESNNNNNTNETTISGATSGDNIAEGGNIIQVGAGNDQEVITTFIESAETQVDDYDVAQTSLHPLEITGIEAGNLSNFLERPLLIHSGVWAQNTTLNLSLDPFKLLIDTTSIQNKLANYALFKFRLNIKVMLNGMPFHHGRLGVHWIPLPNSGNHTTNTTIVPLTTPMKSMRYSQLPGTRACPISPSDNGIYTIEVPFFYPNMYFPIGSYYTSTLTRDFETQYGELILFSTELLAANGASNQDASFSVYSWFSDVSLLGPTLAASGKKKKSSKGPKATKLPPIVPEEEEEDGMISAITSAFAAATGELTEIPLIGPYMRIGSDFLNKSSRALRIFGFSRPSVLTDTSYVRFNPLSNLATTAGVETVEKLSLDPKQSISLDPGISGVGPADSLAIQHLTRHWSQIGAGVWNVGGATDSRIYQIGVSPWNMTSTAFEGGTSFQLSAVSFPTQFFRHWAGTMEYKLIFVTSQYHRGRCMITFDPLGLNATTASSNTRFNIIVDLAESNEIEFSVSWGQDKPYLITALTPIQTTSSSLGIIYNASIMNGAVDIRVLNELTAPDSTGFIDVLVYARAGKDFELSLPDDSLIDRYTVQTPVPASGTISLFGTPNQEAANMKPSIFFGEKVSSLRTMMKRYGFYRSYDSKGIVAPLNAMYTILHIGLGVFPRAYRPFVIPGNNSIDGSGNGCKTHMMCYLRPAYAGWKGSIRWKSVYSRSGIIISQHTASRNPIGNSSSANALNFNQFVGAVSGSPGIALYAPGTSVYRPSGWNGMIATCDQDRKTLEWEVPYYTPYKFSTTNFNYVDDPTSSSTDEGNLTHTVGWNGVTTNPAMLLTVELYVAAAEDFDLLWFLAAPIYFV